MKLFYRVFVHLSIGIVLVLTLWAVYFYYAMMGEINDEVDDTLEDYTELIIIRSLAGEELPSQASGSNNQYFLKPVDLDYAQSRSHICYKDSMVYIEAKKETEPARILTTIFKDKEEQYFELQVSIPTVEKADLIHTILIMILSLYGVMLLAFLIIHVWVFRRSMKPFYRLLAWLDNNRLGGTYTPLDNPTDITEFRKLNEAVSNYAAHSEALYEQQKLFIGHASHEMQTPLAICRNRIEMLLDDDSLSETQLEELAKTHQTLEHVTKLNKSLLLLSKIENRQFSEVSEVNLNQLLHRYIDDYQEAYAYRNITLNVEEKGTFCVKMNETLAVVLITNLLKNAFVHNRDNGQIHIQMSAEGLFFQNTGDDMPLDGKKVFQRFYQGKKKEGSTGLGLAIVHAVCSHFGLQVRYEFVNQHHTFIISH